MQPAILLGPKARRGRFSLEPAPQATRRALIILVVLLIVAVVVAITGIIPRLHARSALRKQTDSMAVPEVAVVTPQTGEPMQEILLPGTIQAYSDAPIYARTNGYVKAWYHDIGAHVHKRRFARRHRNSGTRPASGRGSGQLEYRSGQPGCSHTSPRSVTRGCVERKPYLNSRLIQRLKRKAPRQRPWPSRSKA